MKLLIGLMSWPLLVLCLAGCHTTKAQQWIDADAESFIDSLIAEMTLEEKIGQMNQYNGFFDATGPAPADGHNRDKYKDIISGRVGSMLNVRGAQQVYEMQRLAVEESRLGIPMIFGFDVIHGFKTTMPIPLAEAASWDLDAMRRSCEIAAREAAAAGINWTFAPMVDISRDARWGRVMEGAGEDPFYGSEVAKARVRGFQGESLSDPFTIAACAKHFAGYGFAESGKDYNTADVGTSTLFNVILPPFKAAADAGVCTFMNAFNELNGIPATGDAWLLRDILKGKWDFKGFVVSDWGSIGEMMAHGFAADRKHAGKLALNAGCDMDMESYIYVRDLAESSKDEKAVSHIDEAVRRILRVKYALGLFDDPYRYCNPKREKEETAREEYFDFALEMAQKSIVLLKNERDLLPLKKSGLKIGLIGHLADDPNSPLGSWRLASDDSTAVTVREGLESYKGNELAYEKGVVLYEGETGFMHEVRINETDSTGMHAAQDLAGRSDVVIMVLGEHGYQSGEGRSRSDLGLPGLQQQLLENIYKVNKNIVLVLMNGRPLAIDWADAHIPAIVEAWHLGAQSGHAIASVLYGDYNPSGKLPMTFPRSVGQVPVYYNYKNTGRPGPKTEVFWSHYIDESNEPLYPFGYGLSYTEFEYTDLVAVTDQEGTIELSVKVKNTGDRIGEEVVQAYMQDPVASVTRPVRELKGFTKIELQPGETREVKFVMDDSKLGYYDNRGNFLIEPGEFRFFINGLETSVFIEQ